MLHGDTRCHTHTHTRIHTYTHVTCSFFTDYAHRCVVCVTYAVCLFVSTCLLQLSYFTNLGAGQAPKYLWTVPPYV